MTWLDQLRSCVHSKPLVVFRFDDEKWLGITSSKRGLNHFTFTQPHSLVNDLRTPAICLIFAKEGGGQTNTYIAIVKKCSAVSTLDSRATIDNTRKLSIPSENALLKLVKEKAFSTNLRKRLEQQKDVTPLSSALSVHLVDRLSEKQGNRVALRELVSILNVPKKYSNNSALQEDAVGMALRAFGITSYDPADSLHVEEGRETAIARINIREDAVIEHDARSIPAFSLVASDLTGRAIFRNGSEQLEVITANKRPLEEVLGVDLIYLNKLKQNIVMVQYKMLNPDRIGDSTDWIYRPDGKFLEEIKRMERFSGAHLPDPHEYRINPQVFYLKFVRRDAELGRSAITMPIDHYKALREDPRCKGPRGAFRISYDTLDGRYLRQDAFVDLIRSGYIGAHARTTFALERLVSATLKRDRAVVVAIHTATSS